MSNTIPLDDITGTVINVALGIHTTFHNGLLESAYELLMATSLTNFGLHVRQQVPVTFTYGGVEYVNAFRIDLLVENLVVVEIKARDRLHRDHKRQLMTYLKLTERPVGLLLNFGEQRLKDGIVRMVNNLDPADSPSLNVNSRPKSTDCS